MFKRFIVKHNKSLLVYFDDNLTIEDLHNHIIKILKIKK